MAEEFARRLFRESKIDTSGGAAYDDLTFDQVPENEQWHVRNVCAVDEDNGATKIGVFVRTRYGDYWIQERAFTTAALRRRLKCDFRVRDGEQVIVRITGATQGDTLRAWLVGNYEEVLG